MSKTVWSHLGITVALAALPIIACGGDSPAPVSPTTAVAGASGNADGSTLKVTAPTLMSPVNGVRLENHTPVFRFQNADGLFAQATFTYRLELLTPGGQPVYSRMVPEGSGVTSHTYPGDLENDTPYVWRVRAELQDAHGPWSDDGSFVTFATPRYDPSNVLPFISAFAQGNPQWRSCQFGSGIACHLFVRQLAQTLNPKCEPGSWGVLSKNPGEWQCTTSSCGGFGGQGFGEDILAWGGPPVRIWDVVLGAGAPGAALGWTEISSTRRAGNNWACPW